MVSVIIPCYNMADTLRTAVLSALKQDVSEVIVWDDGSNDNPRAAISDIQDQRIIFCREHNEGLARTLNKAIRVSRGDVIAILGADDEYTDIYLAECLAAMGDGMFASSQVEFIGNDSRNTIPMATNRSRTEWIRQFRKENLMFGGMVFKRSMFDEIGDFNPDIHQLMDLEYLMRVVQKYDLAIVEKPLYKYRINPNGISAVTKENIVKHMVGMRHIRETYGEPMKLMIATPFYENKGYSPYIRSMFQTVYTLARHSNLEFDFQEVSGGSYIDHNRNMMADTFMKSDCTHLMFIDSDQSWDIQGFLNVIKSKKDVVGAAYPVKNNWENYGVTIFGDENNVPIVDEDGLIKAEKVPTGFMKISRDVFDRIKDANKDDWYWHGDHEKLQNYFGHLTIDHVRYGEDISFNLRWLAVGGELWVEPRVSMGHFGAQGWYGNYHEYLMRQPGGSNSIEPLPQAA